ncbi:MAG: hypothetical protein ACREOU_12300 [Candidatus Eiseniibacteriota bacterium]
MTRLRSLAGDGAGLLLAAAAALVVAVVAAVPAAVPAPAWAHVEFSHEVVRDTEYETPPHMRVAGEGVVPAYRVKITNNNRVGLTNTNYGFFGNNFTSRSPSFEFPLGTGFEHMVRGGFWIGGITTYSGTGEQLRVSTGTVDGSQGAASAAGTEFTPAGNTIVERSALPNSRVFSPDAVSEQDFVSDFDDFPAKPTVTSGEDHEPLGISLHQEVYNWSFGRFANFVAIRLTIKNVGPPLRNVWVGMYEEFASGPKNSYSTWPPSSTSGGTLGSWYNKKLMRYDTEGRTLSEHYCRSYLGGEATCEDGVCPPWIGVKLLGVRPDTVANKQITSYIANWAPGDTTKDNDTERHSLMSTGRITPPDSLIPGGSADGTPDDQTSLLAVGPFDEIQPESTITVDFAFVGGVDYEDMLENADFAQLAFDFNYVLPTPPPSPRIAVVPNDGGIDIYFDRSPESVSDPTSPAPGGLDFEGYRVWVGESLGSLRQAAQFDVPDTTGFNTGFAGIALPDSVKIDTTWYQHRYSVRGLKTGFQYFASVTSYDTGDQRIESLESGVTQNLSLTVPGPSPQESQGKSVTVFPNPYKVEAVWDAGDLVRDHFLWFANLPRRCTIKIYTLSGDLVKQVDFDGDTYHGEGARGLYNPTSDVLLDPPTLSGSLYAWDMITSQGQAIASGLYLYAVEDLDGGDIQRGKFLIVKADREGFE